MTVQTTPKWGLRYYQGTDTPAGFTQQQQLAEDVENLALVGVTTLALRPTAAVAKSGRRWYTTDTDQSWVSDGTNWKEIAQVPILGADITDLTIATADLANNAVTAAKIEAQQAWLATPAIGAIGASGTVEYYKDSLGFVHCRGNINFTGNGGGGTFLQLPAGYRPSISTPQSMPQFGQVNGNAICINVNNNGTWTLPAAVGAGSQDYNAAMVHFRGEL